MLNYVDERVITPLINLCQRVPQLSHLLNKLSLEFAHELSDVWYVDLFLAQWAS